MSFISSHNFSCCQISLVCLCLNVIFFSVLLLILVTHFDQGPQSDDFTKITFSHSVFISHATDQAFFWFWLGESLSVFGFLLFHATPSDNARGQITARELFLPSMYPYTKSR